MTHYKWDALDYEKNSTQQQQWARELITKLDLQGDETLLDIGCGDGKVTAEIASQLPAGRAVGVDNAEGMVTLAQLRYPPADFPNLSFRTEDARNLPFQNEFTVVFSNATLHWIRDHWPVLQGIASSLKPGGKILLQMGGRGNAEWLVAVLERLVASDKWAGYFVDFSFPYGFYDPQEYSGWLQEAGLKPQRVELIPKDLVQEGRAGLAGWIRTTWLPYTQRVPEVQRDEFLDEVLDAYLAEHPLDESGKAHVGMVRLEVEAVK